jgi:hypothetical protein
MQRKCSCGSSKSPLQESCSECQAGSLQTFLAVGASDDPYELEADRIADEVLADRPDDSFQSDRLQIHGLPTSHRAAHFHAPQTVERVLSMPGTALEPALRADMERRFGHDFSRVRVHIGPDAGQSARDVNASAFTVGSKIVFGAGQYQPNSRSGRRLLAHELTHVVQQTAPSSIPKVQRDQPPENAQPNLPERIEKGQESYWISFSGFYALIASNIQWHLNSVLPFDMVLLVTTTAEQREEFSPETIAALSSDSFANTSGLTFKTDESELIAILKDGLAQHRGITIDRVTVTVVPVSFDQMERLFGAEKFLAWWNSVLDVVEHGDIWPLVAKRNLWEESGDRGSNGTGTAKDSSTHALERKPEPWVAKQLAPIEEILKKARTDEGKLPKDLPDRIVPWFNERDQSWYVNVWVNFDTQGKDKTGKAVKLHQGEATENLLERLSAAARGAMQQHAKEMPRWALDLKSRLDARLHQITGGKRHKDAPDGTTLRWVDDSTQAQGPDHSVDNEVALSKEDRHEKVLLAIWVEIGEKEVRREYGAVPISPETPLEKLLPYVLKLAAVLRQQEAAPDDRDLNAPDLNVDPTLEPFEARIMPIDLAPDHITVAGASNEFSMFLDLDKTYQAYGQTALYVASKLYNQPLVLDWSVFDVSAEVTATAEAGPDVEWKDRWKHLYQKYNPRGMTDDGDFVATAPKKGDPELAPGTAISSDRGDITSRVKLPDRPGDFLIACVTRSARVGDAKLGRPSSRAFFPVRTVKKETLGDPLITKRSRGIETADLSIKKIKSALAEKGLDENHKRLLLVAQIATENERHTLESHETRSLAESTTAEIFDGNEKLKVVAELKKVLPGVIAQAHANEKSGEGPTAPSKLLEARPDLVYLYWLLLHEGKSVDDYERELKQQLEDLKKLNERAVDFAGSFKSNVDACTYNPEAVFISNLDGHTYPLMLMVGESPVDFDEDPGVVAYKVADVTTEQTKGTYYGASLQEGPQGHIEAIDKAFEDFGEHIPYGEGWIGVRMTRGSGKECEKKHRTEFKYYKCKEGFSERAWRYLGYLAAAVSIAALAATGVGAAGAAAILGLVAGGVGAVLAVHNIQERSRKHTLEVDAELGMDILSILPVGEFLVAGRLARAVQGFENVRRLRNLLMVYRIGTHGAAAILIPIKLAQDVNKIKSLNLPPDQEKTMIAEAYTGALEGGLMFLGASLGSHAGGEKVETYDSIHEQAELMSMEGAGQYQSMQDKGWVDEAGNWTDQAPEDVRRKLLGGAGEEDSVSPKTEPEHQTPAHAGDGAAESKITPELREAANKAADRVNKHEAIVTEDAEGNRHADVGEGHQVEEVEEADGSVDCVYHSKVGVPVACPIGMGGHVEAKPGEPAADSASPAQTSEKLPPNEMARAAAAKALKPTESPTVDVSQLGIPMEEPVKLGSSLSKAKLQPGQEALYILYNENETVLKVGKTSETAIKGRFSVYKRAGKLTGIDVRVEVIPLDMAELKRSGKTTEAFESILRKSMGKEPMLWDNTGGRLLEIDGSSGFGTPGEGIRKSPITKGEMRELLEIYQGSKKKIGEEIGVHARTVDLWAKSLGLTPKAFKKAK